MQAFRTAVAPLLALLAWPALAQVPAAPHLYLLPNRDTLELAVPPAWEDIVDQPEDGGPPTIELHPKDGVPFEVYVTPDWPREPDGVAPDTETLREIVRTTAEKTRGQSGEDALEIRRLQGASGVGFYFVVTETGPEEFQYMNQGALQVGELTLTFTILTNDGQEAIVEQAFAMLRGAAYRDTGRDLQ